MQEDEFDEQVDFDQRIEAIREEITHAHPSPLLKATTFQKRELSMRRLYDALEETVELIAFLDAQNFRDAEALHLWHWRLMCQWRCPNAQRAEAVPWCKSVNAEFAGYQLGMKNFHYGCCVDSRCDQDEQP